MSWAPGAITPNGGRRNDEPLLTDLDEVREVGRPVGELQHAEVAREVGKAGAQVVLERGPSRAPRRDGPARPATAPADSQRVDSTVQALIPGAP